MASKTEFLELIKPLAEEFYDIAILNGNMDIIDTAIKALQNNKANGTDLTELRNVVTTHLAQTTYKRYTGSVKNIDYTAHVYAPWNEATDLPPRTGAYYIDALVRDDIKQTYRKLIARRVSSNDEYEMEMVDGVWGAWVLKTADPKRGTLSKTNDQSIAQESVTPIVFNAVEGNDSGMFNVANASRLVSTKKSDYTVSAIITFATDNAINFRAAFIAKNGDTSKKIAFAQVASVKDSPTRLNLSTTIELNVGDYVELYAENYTASPQVVRFSLTTLTMTKAGA